jgi:hypothetical protein
MVPVLDTLRRRLMARGDDFVSVNQLGPISRAYTSLRLQTSISLATSGINDIKRTARYVDAMASQVVHNGSYIGALKPSMLLVGERRAFAPPYPPAFGPFPATSGHYIFSNMIDVMGDGINRVGFANAYEEDLLALWKSVYSPKVVALGNLAFNELNDVGVPCGAVPHPQYIRRFHHKHGRWYVNLIRRAANQQEDLRKCRP